MATARHNDYMKRALGFLARNGIQSGNFPVIRRDENPREWWAWADYFESLGMHASAGMMRTQSTSWTVPCLDPLEFAPEAADAIERAAAKRLQRHPLTDWERRRIVETLVRPAPPLREGRPMPQDNPFATETEDEFRERMRREIGEIMRERSKPAADEAEPPWITDEEGHPNAGPV